MVRSSRTYALRRHWSCDFGIPSRESRLRPEIVRPGWGEMFLDPWSQKFSGPAGTARTRTPRARIRTGSGRVRDSGFGIRGSGLGVGIRDSGFGTRGSGARDLGFGIWDRDSGLGESGQLGFDGIRRRRIDSGFGRSADFGEVCGIATQDLSRSTGDSGLGFGATGTGSRNRNWELSRSQLKRVAPVRSASSPRSRRTSRRSFRLQAEGTSLIADSRHLRASHRAISVPRRRIPHSIQKKGVYHDRREQFHHARTPQLADRRGLYHQRRHRALRGRPLGQGLLLDLAGGPRPRAPDEGPGARRSTSSSSTDHLHAARHRACRS